MNKSTKIAASMMAASVLTPLMALTAYAQTPTLDVSADTGLKVHLGGRWRSPDEQPKKPDVFGSVTAVNGTTLTLESRAFGSASTSTLTIDASAAAVTTGPEKSASLSDISVGDKIAVRGTVDGSTVTATEIHLGGLGLGHGRGHGPRPDGEAGEEKAGLLDLVTGDGSPVVVGKVTAAADGTLTVANKAAVAYTVDATDAKVVSAGKAATLTDIAVGDTVVVQGAVNGSSVDATTVIETRTSAKPLNRFFGRIHSLFSKLFGL